MATPIEQQPASVLRSNSSEQGEVIHGGDFNVLDLLAILAGRKRLILAVTFAFTIIACVVALLLPARYTATVTLLTPQQNSSLASAIGSQMGSLGGMAALAGGSLNLKNPNDVFVGMLKSRTVEDAMIHKFNLMNEYHSRLLSDARKRFERNTDVDGSSKDGLIHISVEDQNPDRAALLANGYVDEFGLLSAHLAITEASQRRLFFEQQLEQEKNMLANAEESLKSTEQSTGVIQLDSQARALIETAASIRAQITAREVQIQGMQSYATGENSQLIQAQRELESLRSQLAKLGNSGDSTDASLIVPKGKVTEAGLEYVRKMREVKYHETIFEILARQFEVAKLDEAKEGSLIQVVDKAITPDVRTSPHRTIIVAVSAGCGLFVGILLALLESTIELAKRDTELSAKLDRLRGSLRRRPNTAH